MILSICKCQSDKIDSLADIWNFNESSISGHTQMKTLQKQCIFITCPLETGLVEEFPTLKILDEPTFYNLLFFFVVVRLFELILHYLKGIV